MGKIPSNLITLVALGLFLMVEAAPDFEPLGVIRTTQTTPTTTSSTTTTTTATTTTTTTEKGTVTNAPGTPDPNDATAMANSFAIDEIRRFRSEHQLPANSIAYNLKLISEAKKCAELYYVQTPSDTKQPTQLRYYEQQCPTVPEGANEIIFHSNSPDATDALAFSKVFQEAYTQGSTYKLDGLTNALAQKHEIFTQILWKDTTEMGCACHPKPHVEEVAGKSPARYICSCLFNPGGNVRVGFGNAGLFHYKANVLPKK